MYELKKEEAAYTFLQKNTMTTDVYPLGGVNDLAVEGDCSIWCFRRYSAMTDKR